MNNNSLLDYNDLNRKYISVKSILVVSCILIVILILISVLFILVPDFSPKYRLLKAEQEAVLSELYLAQQECSRLQSELASSNEALSAAEAIISDISSVEPPQPAPVVYEDAYDDGFSDGWSDGAFSAYSAGFLQGKADGNSYSSDFMSSGEHLRSEYSSIIEKYYSIWFSKVSPSNPD